ncbi:MAG: bifunctional hydroxymethylpyrimidine kinase/phosphomethylpyrimidine kinase [Actinomycetota bacterium]|nr:bifunctional hydroxymethylpyrimidine kinase/phosphomethylpyrimidine kinase [Actinomycetota bacterium]
MELPVVLTVAGSDSGGGAGIQADLKTFHACGVHGVCAVTSVTSQNTREVAARCDLPAEVVASQLETILGDIEVRSAKTGMLARSDTVDIVAGIMVGYGMERLVVDPVILSSSGQPLLDHHGLEILVERLLPLAVVFTPNLEEASTILGKDIVNRKDMREAALELRDLGPSCVVVKGGHLGGEEAIDFYCDGERVVELAAKKVDTRDDHGTGCVFSAAVAAHLALGRFPLEAVRRAKQDVTRALSNSLHIGAGRGPIHPLPEAVE